MQQNKKVIHVSLFDKQKKGLIVKANELVEARYRLTANEQKLILAMVACIQPEDEDFKSYRFEVKELAEFMGVKSKAIYKEISKIAIRLRKRDINIYKSETNSFINTGWLSSSEYFMGEGAVELCFDPKLKPYLLKLKDRFIKYRPEIIRQIHSGYSIRVYELLKQYEKIKKRIFPIGELREILGVGETEYKRYYDFKKYVLLIAQRDLNENTDIKIGFREVRKGKRVEAIEFIILSNIKSKEEIKEPEIVEEMVEIRPLDGLQIEGEIIFKRLVDYFLLSQSQAKEVIGNFPKDYLAEQIKNIEKDFESKQIRNKGAYAYKAIVEGYQYRKSLFDVEKNEKEKQEQASSKMIEKLREEFAKENSAKIEKYQENEDIMLEFLNEKINHNKMLKSRWGKDKFNNPFVLGAFRSFIEEKYLQAEDSFEAWAKGMGYSIARVGDGRYILEK
jgi:plasmid replication initiation protein